MFGVSTACRFGELVDGISLQSMLQDSGINHRQIDDGSIWISPLQELRVLRNLLNRLSDRTGTGFDLGMMYPTEYLGAYGVKLLTSSSGHEALNFAVEYLPLSPFFCQLKLTTNGDRYQINIIPPASLDRRMANFLLERDISICVGILEGIVGEDFLPERIEVALKNPKNLPKNGVFGDAYENIFHFNAPQSHIEIDSKYLNRRPFYENEAAAALNDNICKSLLERMKIRADYTQRVLSFLKSKRQQLPSLTDTATFLGTSSRTLIRKLKKEGACFKSIMTNVRQDYAEELLLTTDLSIGAISKKLNYNDHSALCSAFRKRYSVTPTLFRRLSMMDNPKMTFN